MELPAALKSAVDRLLDNQKLAPMVRASERLTRRYRAEVRDGRWHLDDDLSARAYLAARLPATYAAVRAAMAMVEAARPGYAPATMIDLGAGPGTALWAAADCWPDLARATMVEASPAIRGVGEHLTRALPEALAAGVTWRSGDLVGDLPTLDRADLVTLAYVLDELPIAALSATVRRLFALTDDLLLVIEPGTPAGFERIRAARAVLLAEGARLIAPCPHQDDCPIAMPDWCHFSRRVARSRRHLQVKQAEVPYEDEKYIFLAARRVQTDPITNGESDGDIDSGTGAAMARVLAPARSASGQVRLKLCTAAGRIEERSLSRRDGERFKSARKADWGDAISLGPDP